VNSAAESFSVPMDQPEPEGGLVGVGVGVGVFVGGLAASVGWLGIAKLRLRIMRTSRTIGVIRPRLELNFMANLLCEQMKHDGKPALAGVSPYRVRPIVRKNMLVRIQSLLMRIQTLHKDSSFGIIVPIHTRRYPHFSLEKTREIRNARESNRQGSFGDICTCSQHDFGFF